MSRAPLAAVGTAPSSIIPIIPVGLVAAAAIIGSGRVFILAITLVVFGFDRCYFGSWLVLGGECWKGFVEVGF